MIALDAIVPGGIPLGVKLLLALAIFAGGAGVGATWVERGKNAEIATVRQQHAETEKAAALQARQRLEEAQARGDALHKRLIQAENARKTQFEETTREIQRLTTGRPCLSGAAVRLLNSPGLRLGTVSAPAGGVVAADEAAATDTDLGLWIASSLGQYGECRQRLQALIDWHEGGTE